MSNVTENKWGVYEIRSKATYAGPGMYGYDAEARVEDHDGNTVYVHVNDYEGLHFTVSKTSIYDFMTGNGEDPKAVFTEEYEGLGDTTESKYHKVFVVLDQVLQLMEGD